jgi:hypothetical protein
MLEAPPSRQDQEHSIAELNILLCDELSAIISYDVALRGMASPPQLELALNRESHKQRSVLLADAITARGRITDTGIVVWGILAEDRSPGHAIDRRMAIDALLDGENRMLAHYGTAQLHVDPRHRQLLASELVPAQELTCGRIKFIWMSGTPPSPPAP